MYIGNELNANANPKDEYEFFLLKIHYSFSKVN